MILHAGITLRHSKRLKSWLYSPLIALLAIRRAPAGQQHTPKTAFVAGAHDHTASSGKQFDAPCIVLNLRALSTGKLHHEITWTGGGWDRNRCGNPGQAQGGCADQPERRRMDGRQGMVSRSAWLLMEGWVQIPGAVF